MDLTPVVQVAGDMPHRGAPFLGLRYEIFGIPTFLLWNLLIILILALIFYWLLRSSRQTKETPMDLLKKRYVKGEIDKKTFNDMKKTISD